MATELKVYKVLKTKGVRHEDGSPVKEGDTLQLNPANGQTRAWVRFEQIEELEKKAAEKVIEKAAKEQEAELAELEKKARADAKAKAKRDAEFAPPDLTGND